MTRLDTDSWEAESSMIGVLDGFDKATVESNRNFVDVLRREGKKSFFFKECNVLENLAVDDNACDVLQYLGNELKSAGLP